MWYTCQIELIMDELYQENILDHAKTPRNYGELVDASCNAKGDNPSCGDSAELFLKLDDSEVVTNASFTGYGCAVSQASMSILTAELKGKNIHQLKSIMPGDIYKMLGINISPARVNCALLSYRALEQTLMQYDKNKRKYA